MVKKFEEVRDRIEHIRYGLDITEDLIKINWHANHWLNVMKDMRQIVDLMEFINDGQEV